MRPAGSNWSPGGSSPASRVRASVTNATSPDESSTSSSIGRYTSTPTGIDVRHVAEELVGRRRRDVIRLVVLHRRWVWHTGGRPHQLANRGRESLAACHRRAA